MAKQTSKWMRERLRERERQQEVEKGVDDQQLEGLSPLVQRESFCCIEFQINNLFVAW